MKNITRDNLTDTVKSSFANIDDERLRHLVNRLAHHLHAFASETQLTHDEWREGIGFLHRAAEISSPSRSEFTLMSDVLGLSSLVDLLAARPGATEGSVLGPFHTRGSPWMDNGANLIRDNPGEAVLIRGRVTDIHGQARTLYCLRHTAITFRLLYGQGIDMLTLARNARTSVDMIENFYASTLSGEMNVGMLQSRRATGQKKTPGVATRG